MKIVALYVAFQGDGFVRASVDSIYPFVDKIVFAQSRIGWAGTPDKAENTVLPVIKQWKKVNDSQNKIINIEGNWGNQLDHYNAGVTYIRKHLKSDYVMIIDTDEVWASDQLQEALHRIKQDIDYIEQKMESVEKLVRLQRDGGGRNLPSNATAKEILTQAFEEVERVKNDIEIRRDNIGFSRSGRLTISREDIEFIIKEVRSLLEGDKIAALNSDSNIREYFSSVKVKIKDREAKNETPVPFINFPKNISMSANSNIAAFPISFALAKPLIKLFVWDIESGFMVVTISLSVFTS